eukprot:SAG11_NODE_37274_length_257_cov_1.626582_1_plen_42_part_01
MLTADRSTQPAFEAPNPYAIDRGNVVFVRGPCDPWGNVDGEV